MKKILRYLRSSLGYLYVCFKWVILAALVGCVVGPFVNRRGKEFEQMRGNLNRYPKNSHCRCA